MEKSSRQGLKRGHWPSQVGGHWRPLDEGVEARLQWLDSVNGEEVEGTTKSRSLAAKAKFKIKLFSFFIDYKSNTCSLYKIG